MEIGEGKKLTGMRALRTQEKRRKISCFARNDGWVWRQFWPIRTTAHGLAHGELLAHGLA